MEGVGTIVSVPDIDWESDEDVEILSELDFDTDSESVAEELVVNDGESVREVDVDSEMDEEVVRECDKETDSDADCDSDDV